MKTTTIKTKVCAALLVTAVAGTALVAGKSLINPSSTNDNTKTIATGSSSATPPQQNAAPNPTAAATTQRNLANYETLGPFNLPGNLTPAAREQIINRVRAFVWQKWQAKRRARVSYIATIMRGFAPGTTSFFIEPDNQNKWKVTIEVQGQTVPQSYYTVEQITVGADGLPLAEGETPSPNSRTALHLIPAAGGVEELIL